MSARSSYYGITTNNIKNIDIDILHNQITLLYGPSGSGKSTIAVDTIYNISEDELHQLMNLKENVSTYSVRDYINILPSICLQQENYNKNPRSTIATYFNIDILFKELFSIKNSVSQKLFQFNTLETSCKKCKGTGSVPVPDILKIVDYSTKMNEMPFMNWRSGGKEYYEKLLTLHLADNGIEQKLRFKDLSEKVQNDLLYSKAYITYKISYFVNGRKHTKTSAYKGPIYELMEEFTKDKLPESKRKYFSLETCDKCNGAKFSDEVLIYKVYDKNIGELYLLEIDLLLEWINKWKHMWQRYQAERRLFERIVAFLESLLSLNLNYLNLNRSIPSLSGGELQRLRLAKAKNAQFANFLYVLDEPTAGLHPSEWNSIKKLILELKAKHNTVLIVEHNKLINQIADKVFYLGPGGGKIGGNLVDLAKIESLQTVKAEYCFFKKAYEIEINHANYNNVRDLSIKLPLETLVGVCGVSGSGKTSFLEGIIPRYINDTVYLNQAPIRGNSYSIVATAVNVIDEVKSIFSKSNNVPSDYFTYNSVGNGQCEICFGRGYLEDESYFEESKLICPSCEGKRFSKKSLKYKFNDLSIYEFLCLSVDDMVELVPKSNKRLLDVLNILLKVGLGYLNLFQDISSLSGGEAQRIKFVNTLLKFKQKRVYLLDEPFRGVDSNNINRIIGLIYDLIEQKYTFYISEHNVIPLNLCSYIIEFGPGAGNYGGNVLYSGEKGKIKSAPESMIRNYLN